MDNIFLNNFGSIEFAELKVDNRYEYEEANSIFWEKTSAWYEIKMIRVNEKFNGYGKILLNEFLNSINRAGVVLNAVPVDGDISEEDLIKWYEKSGFESISKDNKSLYRIV